MTSWDIYWITRLGPINGLLWALVVIGTIAGIVMGIMYLVTSSPPQDADDRKISAALGPFLKKFYPALLLLHLALTMVPTLKEACAIYIIPKMANSQAAAEAAKIPENMAKLLNMKLEEWISDVTGVEKKEKK